MLRNRQGNIKSYAVIMPHQTPIGDGPQMLLAACLSSSSRMHKLLSVFHTLSSLSLKHSVLGVYKGVLLTICS